MAELIRLQKYSYAYPGTDRFVLRDVGLTIKAGECHCLGGPTGSGKTSLALALKGLLPDGTTEGVINRTLPEGGRSGGLGIVLQNPETQILRRSVGAEVAFGLENLGVDPDKMPGRVRAALDRVGLDKNFGAESGKLSMGEKYRLILAGQLVMDPGLLIIDEPAAQLDPVGLADLLKIVRELKATGIAFLLCENQPGPLSAVIDHYWHIDSEGRLAVGQEASRVAAFGSPPEAPAPAAHRSVDDVIEVTGVTVSGSNQAAIWHNVSFTVPRSCRLVLTGANGSGKTTMVRCLTGFIRPDAGAIRVFGARPRAGDLRGKVGCLFQNPQRQLFETTVFAEVAFPLKRLQRDSRELAARVNDTLARCGIDHLALRSPHTLSYGQKHLVALASVLIFEPQLLLLDDPFAGLDPATAEKTLRLLAELNRRQETTIVLATHEPGELAGWADQTLRIAGGSLVVH